MLLWYTEHAMLLWSIWKQLKLLGKLATQQYHTIALTEFSEDNRGKKDFLSFLCVLRCHAVRDTCRFLTTDWDLPITLSSNWKNNFLLSRLGFYVWCMCILTMHSFGMCVLYLCTVRPWGAPSPKSWKAIQYMELRRRLIQVPCLG